MVHCLGNVIIDNASQITRLVRDMGISILRTNSWAHVSRLIDSCIKIVKYRETRNIIS
jgi:hypothetical protein